MIYLEHPDLPGQGIRVRPGAVPTYRASGWQPADEPAPAEEPEPQALPRRRRAPRQSEGDEQ